MLCVNCHTPAISIKSMLEENTNGMEAFLEVHRGFCPKCGAVLRPINPNFLLVVFNLTIPNLNAYSILEKGDTFSQVWLMVPTYKELFSTMDGRFVIKILSRTSNPFETKKQKVKYDVVYEEEVSKSKIVDEQEVN